jgi:hypothetical protein
MRPTPTAPTGLKTDALNRTFVLAAVLVSGTTLLFGQSGAAPPAASAVIKTHCLSCHSGATAAGRLSFVSLDADHPAGNPEVWERVVRQLRARTMPPMAAPRPDERTYQSTISALTSAIDRGASTAAGPVSDTALAVRLAKMIWNSEPDQSLSDAASRGTLRDPKALQAEVRRLLADPRAAALVNGFFAPWLSLDALRTMKGDSALFPEFDSELREAFLRETTLFVQSLLRANSHPAALWTADYTFLNERLARHYGIPNVAGPEYRRVNWPAPDRAGLLAQGSILTLTSRPYVSYPVDVPTTSPAERAKWILTRFLGVDPPATVPNVPPVDFPFDKHTPLVKQSRTFPATPCLACHRSFFPLAHGLENFDVLGRWRADYGGDSIDAAGTMVDGTTFNGPVELRRALLARQDAFLNVLTERLMAYSIDGTTAALPTPASRMPAVRAALRAAAADGYSWSSLIAAIAKVPSD